ncbi:hypothetical protein SSX86_005167 [Deinandra increscens subsp. villosa]|uniref:CCT domain-containing protein n=1 Tax=Deinandra increscens subsp. villosa TaxID=3103831 RepID=A0AAP0DPH4_9ASTR
MSSILSGGRAYGFEVHQNVVKSPLSSMTTNSSRTYSQSSSPSSTLSESSNSTIRKPRTPRKRPNQTYNEAAFLLSIACPKVFSSQHLTTTNNLSKFTTQNNGASIHNPPPPPEELLLQNSSSGSGGTVATSAAVYGSSRICDSPEEEVENHRSWNSGSTSSIGLCEGGGFEDGFDTESMLDEEVEEGIDCIMGSWNSERSYEESNNNICYGYPMGLGLGGNLEFSFGMRNGVRALKNGEDDGWSFPTVNLVNVSSPAKVKKWPVEKKKMKIEELMKRSEPESVQENCTSSETGPKLLLKLNYDDVLVAWSDKGSPLPEEISGSESPDGDIHARLAQIDLFSENGGLREASVMRYKEKKRTRLFSKKIRYQVRKVNADRRPRSKGRFVRRSNSEDA